MCGGRGTRLESAHDEKPLVDVGGRPAFDRVLAALCASDVDDVVAVASPHAPATRDRAAAFAARDACTVVDAPGDGYVADLRAGLAAVDDPAVTVVADLPLLAPTDVDRAASVAAGRSLTTAVPTALKRERGVSVDATFEDGGRTLAPTGLNVVAADDDDGAVDVVTAPRLAVNVNRPDDVAVARTMAATRDAPWLAGLPPVDGRPTSQPSEESFGQ